MGSRKSPLVRGRTKVRKALVSVITPPAMIFASRFALNGSSRHARIMAMGISIKTAAEFQKMVDRPGILQDFITAPLCHLQLGRAQAMMGDKAAARKSYEDFLTIWKDADPDIPIYQQAKAEYARLQ